MPTQSASFANEITLVLILGCDAHAANRDRHPAASLAPMTIALPCVNKVDSHGKPAERGFAIGWNKTDLAMFDGDGNDLVNQRVQGRFDNMPVFMTAAEPAKPKDASESDLAKLPFLGMNRDSVIRLCGKPLEEKILPPADPNVGGINWMRFQAGDYRLIVEIAPNTRKVVQIYHFRKRPITDHEMAGLLERNAQGHQWTGEKFAWKRSDGATARGGVNQGGESQIILLDPSWNNRP